MPMRCRISNETSAAVKAKHVRQVLPQIQIYKVTTNALLPVGVLNAVPRVRRPVRRKSIRKISQARDRIWLTGPLSECLWVEVFPWTFVGRPDEICIPLKGKRYV
jgi:hypothetical protein